MKRFLFCVALCLFGLCVAGAENEAAYAVVGHGHARVKKFPEQADPAASEGKVFVIPREGIKLEFGFYSKIAPKKLIFRRTIAASELITDGKYHNYSLGYHVLPEAGTVSFFVTDAWGLMLDNLLNRAIREIGAGTIRELSVSLRADEKNVYVDRILFSLPENMKNSKGEIFQASATYARMCRFERIPDPRFFKRQLVKIPLDEQKPIEFGFYDREAKKVVFRKKFSKAEIPDDGRFHLYSLGVHPLPAAGRQIAFWCHDNWNLILKHVLEGMQTKYPAESQWEIFASFSCDGKNIMLEQIIFASPAETK